MGIEDIVYDLIKEYRASRLEKQKTKESEQRQFELAKSIVKKAYLRFNFDWTTEKDKDMGLDEFIYIRKTMFKQYSQIFLDIAVEIYDVLPDESEKLKDMSRGLKSAAVSFINAKEIRNIGNSWADKALKYYEELNR
jgi:HD-GYP domain-containing protein (c-di-GMP phosphodiesterase class II)